MFRYRLDYWSAVINAEVGIWTEMWKLDYA